MTGSFAGLVQVSAGTVNVTGPLAVDGGLKLSGGTLGGSGAVSASGKSIWSGGSMSGTGSTTFNGALDLSGGTRTVTGRGVTFAGTSTWALGNFSTSNGARLSNTGSFLDQAMTTDRSINNNSGVASSFANLGSYTKSGSAKTTIGIGFGNSGTLNVDAGTLALTSGLQDRGITTIGSGGTLQLGAASSTARMAINGGTLALGSSSITVSGDYSNTGFGAGNSFNRRAGITGTGLVLAAGTTQQTISGATVSNGGSALATLAIPSRADQLSPATASFTIHNVGSGGPSLRGAIQTTGITSTALSGSGVTPDNWGPVAQGGSSAAFTVSFDPRLAATLSGQALQIVNNFGNVTGQTLAITSKVYAPAIARLDTPAALDFGIVRVGDVVTRNVSVSNTATGALTDQLGATLNGGGAPFAAAGAARVAAGGSANFGVTLDTRIAGSFSDNGSLTLTSHNSEMADLALGSAALSFTAQVNNLAVAALDKTGGGGSFAVSGGHYVLNFGTLTLGSSSVVTALSLSNTAQGLADALAGSFSSLVPGSAFTLSAPVDFANLQAGEALSGLKIRFDTGSLGSFDQVLTLSTLSTNASDPLGRALGSIELHLHGTVAAVPEPGSWLMLAVGLLWLGGVGRRRLLNRSA